MVRLPTTPLSPATIDTYLEQGWFRFGGVMRTTRYSVWEERDLRTTLWIRSCLRDFRFSRSNRRLLKKIHKRFEVRRHPMVVDARHQELYAAYIVHVGGDRPATLIDFLGGEDAALTWDTQEISLWEHGELVGFCYFDAGQDSLMSLLGVFSPLHATDSIGYATLLLEVELALERGMQFHYSGYVLPGEPRMDYKLRVGGIEFLEPDTGAWHPWSDFRAELLPDRRMRRQLDRVGRALAMRGIRCRRMLNPLFEMAHTATLDEQMVDQPMVLLVGERTPLHLITWDDAERRYVVELGVPAYVRHRRGPDGPEHTTPTAIVKEHVAELSNADAVAELLAG